MASRSSDPKKRRKDDEDMEDSDSDSEEEEEAMRLDNVMEDEGVEDVVFDFDDPQEKHWESIRGLLERCWALGDVDSLAEIVAKDPASVGTVVEVADNEVVCVAAVIRLQHYTDGANRGVDDARRILTTAGITAADKASTSPCALVVRAKMVNVPPRVVAAAYRCLKNDVANLGFHAFVVIVPVPQQEKSANSSKKSKVHLDCDDFDDDLFTKRASLVVPLDSSHHSRRPLSFAALYIPADAFNAAIDDISRLADQ